MMRRWCVVVTADAMAGRTHAAASRSQEGACECGGGGRGEGQHDKAPRHLRRLFLQNWGAQATLQVWVALHETRLQVCTSQPIKHDEVRGLSKHRLQFGDQLSEPELCLRAPKPCSPLLAHPSWFKGLGRLGLRIVLSSVHARRHAERALCQLQLRSTSLSARPQC
eukprot:556650-Rhodomonas_salina.1